MKLFGRIFVLLALMMMPAVATAMQATPEVPAPPTTDTAPDGTPTPFGNGIGSPATYFDSRGNPIFSVTVTAIDLDWQEYDTYSAPDVGKVYVALHVQVINESSRAGTLSPYQFTMVDSFGMGNNYAYIYDNEDVWLDDVSVGAGETTEGTMVFALYSDVDPMMLVYQPDYSAYVFIYLGDN